MKQSEYLTLNRLFLKKFLEYLNLLPESNLIFPTVQEREIYFNPSNSIGTSHSDPDNETGIGNTITINNPGAGPTTRLIPRGSIFLPEHGLKTGDVVNYELNGVNGSETAPKVKFFSATPTVDTTVGIGTSLFVIRKTDNLIGLSTVRVGLGSTGVRFGLGLTGTQPTFEEIQFLDVGIGSIHSLRVKDRNTVSGSITRNIVTVVGTGTHGLKNNDTVIVDVNPGINTTITVKYNKIRRRAVYNPLDYVAAGIVTGAATGGIRDSIEIKDHKLSTGEKIIHTSDSPIGLENNKEYYVYVVDENTLKFVESRYQLSSDFPEFVGISSTGDGTISPINPPLVFYQDSNAIFDLSDSSLSYKQSATSYPAFNFNFFKDQKFNEIYETSGQSAAFDVSRVGTIGVTADAKVTLKVNKNTPNNLYYKLSPIDVSDNLTENKEIIVDDDVFNNNNISKRKSIYSGEFNIVSTGSTTFTYDLEVAPESDSYTPSSSTLRYSTISTSAYGSIDEITITESGGGYEIVPGITTITSNVGSGAVIESFTSTIGKPTKVSLQNIGFDYPTDTTLKPEALFPQVLRISPLSGFKSIGITSFGRGYNQNPSLVVLDGVTKKLIGDVDLKYNPEEEIVEVLENTESLNESTPTIIPIGNPNGIRAQNFTYDNDTQEVTVTMKNAFSGTLNAIGEYIDPFPFSVGDKVLVENVSVGVGSTASGYNSSDYDYALFTLTKVHPNYGGVGIVTYSMSEFLEKNIEFPGIFNAVKSNATLVPEKYFPQFDIKLQPTNFRIDDDIQMVDSSGTVVKGTVSGWNNSSKYITIESNREFEIGQIIEQTKFRGERTKDNEYTAPTGAKGIITEKIKYESKYNTDHFAIVDNGWQRNTGFLNDEIQRIHDNDFYHAFSYSVKSKVQFDEWKDIVGSLNHTAGFKKFANLQVESQLPSNRFDDLVVRPESVVTKFVDLISVKSLQSFHDFDLVSENYVTGFERPFSDEFNFKSRILTDFSESVSNRVVTIDDFSNIFNNNARSTPFADVLSK